MRRISRPAKAFDTVVHEVLVSKLEHYGICGVPLQWLKSFLTQRQQYLSIKNTIPTRHSH